MRDVLQFLKTSISIVLRGDARYYRWVGFLTFWIVLGIAAWIYQFIFGLQVTSLTDQVPWGAYIANFSFTVGLASAALILVILSWLNHGEHLGELIVVGQITSIAALTMGMLFVVVDLGRPDRFWHLIPVIGMFNFPISMLSWDVVVLNGYLALNFYLATYWVFSRFRGSKVSRAKYRPILMVAIGWAVSIHVIAAFLYAGLGSRPHWNAAILAPRVLASAFGSGPAMLIIILTVIRDRMGVPIRDNAIGHLRQVLTVAALANLFFFGAEIFTELYAGTAHATPLRYLLFGLRGHHLLVPFIWAATALNVGACVVLCAKTLYSRNAFLIAACAATIVGMWVEKGMGLVIPGFIPSSLGEIVEYAPSFVEFCVCAGVWAIGGLVLTVLLRVAVPVEFLGLRMDGARTESEATP